MEEHEVLLSDLARRKVVVRLLFVWYLFTPSNARQRMTKRLSKQRTYSIGARPGKPALQSFVALREFTCDSIQIETFRACSTYISH